MILTQRKFDQLIAESFDRGRKREQRALATQLTIAASRVRVNGSIFNAATEPNPPPIREGTNHAIIGSSTGAQ